jgi:hypothetical protein
MGLAGLAAASTTAHETSHDWGSSLERVNDPSNDARNSLIDIFDGGLDAISREIIQALTYLIAEYPDTHPNEHVAGLHKLSLGLTVILSGLTLLVIGLHYESNFVIGNIGPNQAARLFPKLLAALAVGAVAPHLIQYLLELFGLLTVIFPPAPGVVGAVRITGSLFLVALFQAIGLIAVGVFFVVRNVYIMFFAAFAPIIFLMAATPYLRGFAGMLTGAFLGFIIVGPVEMALFNLTVSFLDTGLWIPHWIATLGGIALLMVVPYAFVTVGAQAAGQAASPVPSVNITNSSKQTENRDREPPREYYRPPPRGRY